MCWNIQADAVCLSIFDDKKPACLHVVASSNLGERKVVFRCLISILSVMRIFFFILFPFAGGLGFDKPCVVAGDK